MCGRTAKSQEDVVHAVNTEAMRRLKLWDVPLLVWISITRGAERIVARAPAARGDKAIV